MSLITVVIIILTSVVNCEDVTTQLNEFTDQAILAYRETGFVALGQRYSSISKKYGGQIGVDILMRDTKVDIDRMTRNRVLYDDKNFAVIVNMTISKLIYFATGEITAGTFKEKRNLTGFTDEFYVLVKFVRCPGGRFSSGVPQVEVSKAVEWKEFKISDDNEEHVQEFKNLLLQGFKTFCLECHLDNFKKALWKSFNTYSTNLDKIIIPPQLEIPSQEKMNSFFDSVFSETLGKSITVAEHYAWPENYKFEYCEMTVKTIDRVADAKFYEDSYQIWSKVKSNLGLLAKVDPSNNDAPGFHQVVGNVTTYYNIGVLIGSDGKFSSGEAVANMHFRFDITMVNVTKEVETKFKQQSLWILDSNAIQAMRNFVIKKMQGKLIQ